MAGRKESPDGLSPLLYVAIGASAGGLEAIDSFFSHMPTDTGMAFIVIQHLSPDYKSLMVELLSKRTRMNVYRAEDQLEVKPDSVYLIPPKKNMTIFHGKLMLTDQDHSQGLNLPIDIFFNSLATDQGEKAVAIILSGTGSDGMRGVKAVKEAGGMIMVQDENTAKFDGMPRSAISTGLADLVLAPEDMPDQLISYSQQSQSAPLIPIDTQKINHENIARIFSLLRSRTGVDFTFYKPSTIIRRLERRMNLNQITEISEYARFLENFPQELNLLYKELLIGVTSFFRDSEAFDFLAEKVIPALFANAEGERLRIWVAGCSTGEEAYSIAMLFHEHMEKTGKKLDVKIFATDIDRDAIVKAGNGIYPESSAMEIGQARVGKYFQNRSGQLQIARHIRQMVVFAQHNLIKDPPFTNIDLISCRNMLIYLQPVLQKKAMAIFHFSLRAEGLGYLFLGSSETTGEYSDSFKSIDRKWKFFTTIGKHNVSYERDFVNTFIHKTAERKAPAHYSSGMRGMKPYQEDRFLERLLQSLADEQYPLIIMINESGEIVYLIGDATGILKFPSGRMISDITKLATKAIAIPLSTGIQKVFKKGEEVCYSNIKLEEGIPRPINLHIRLVPEKKGQERMAVVFVRPASSEPGIESEKPGRSFDVAKETQQRINDLEQELQFTKENLQATIEELETSNEELQATNEELLSLNEELHSTNEELQSVNEELFTVNSEYQHKILELTELNNDIDNLLRSIEVGTIFLDENLEIRKFTPRINSVIKILDQDIGRPFHHLSHHLGNIDLMEHIKRVKNTGNAENVEYFSLDKCWYLIKILPYKISPRLASGIIITFIDIDEIKETRNALMREQNILRQTGEMAKIGGWRVDLETGEIHWTNQIYQIYGISASTRPNDVAGQMSFYPQEVHETLNSALEKAKNTGEEFDLTLPFNSANNRKLWVRIIGRGLKSKDRVIAIDGTMQDVTSAVNTRKSLERTLQLFEVFMEWDNFEKHGNASCDSCASRLSLLVDKNIYDGVWLAVKDLKTGLFSVVSKAGSFEKALKKHKTAITFSINEKAFVSSAQIDQKIVLSQSLFSDFNPKKLAAILAPENIDASVIPIISGKNIKGMIAVLPHSNDILSPQETETLKKMADKLPQLSCARLK